MRPNCSVPGGSRKSWCRAACISSAPCRTPFTCPTFLAKPSRSDDALWALDGLSSGSDATVRDSLAALAEICASRRGRLALRSGNVAAEILAAAGVLCMQCLLCLLRMLCTAAVHA